MDLTEFIVESNQTKNIEELTNNFLKFLSAFGMDRFIMGQISHDSTAQKEKYLGLLVNYPQEWMEYYVANHYVNHDPVYLAALTARKPFSWTEIEAQKNLSKKSQQVMNECREHKMYSGVGLSIHQPLGGIIGMGFAGTQKDARCDKDALSLIYAAANQFFICYADLTKFNALDPENINLTNRECEVLLWLARGKTKTDVSDILAVSESSIKRHCESIFQKLDVNNIPLAVAKAIRMGLIRPF